MNRSKMSTVEIRQWREDGVICLRGVFDQGWMNILETVFEKAFKNASALAKDYAKGGKGSFFTGHGMYRLVEELHEFIFKSPAAGIAASLMAADTVNLIDDHLLLKEPGTDNPTYWHQDQPYFNFAGEDFVSLWIPIDPVDESNGTMRFVKGSHLWGKKFTPYALGLAKLSKKRKTLMASLQTLMAIRMIMKFSPGVYYRGIVSLFMVKCSTPRLPIRQAINVAVLFHCG